MTACKDFQVSGKKAVSATLAGALAVGMVPAVALAAPASEATDEAVNDDLELLTTVDKIGAFNQGNIVKVTEKNGAGKTIDVPDSGLSYPADGGSKAVVPVSAMPAESTKAVDLTAEDADGNAMWTISYYKSAKSTDTDASGNSAVKIPGQKNASGEDVYGLLESDPDLITAAGTYYAVATATQYNTQGYYSATPADNAAVAVPFVITGKDLKDAVAFDKSGEDITDTVFTYNGGIQQFGLTLDGKELVENKDYEVVRLSAFGSSNNIYDQTKKDGSSNATLAKGVYVAVVQGRAGTIYSTEKAEIQFTVDALDLSKADIVTKTVTSVPASGKADNPNDLIESINGTTVSSTVLGNEIAVSFKEGPNGSSVSGEKGEYKYTVSADEDTKNVINSSVVSLIYATSVIQDQNFNYVSNDMSSYTKVSPLQVALDDEDTAFAAGNIQVLDTDNTTPLDKKDYNITVATADGKAATVADLASKPGLYKVTATVNAKKLEYAKAGAASMWVKVVKSNITDTADVFVSYDGVVDDEIYPTYTGKDLMSDIKVVVKDSKGNVVDPSEYTVAITCEGQTVKEIVDEGEYTIKVTSENYNITGDGVCTVNVQPIDIVRLRVADQKTLGTNSFLPYTGETITPTLEYLTNPGETKEVWAELPTDIYEIVSYGYHKTSKTPSDFKDADEIKDAGFYNVKISMVSGTKNYTFTVNTTDVVEVSKKKVYLDVATSDWFAEVVYQCFDNEYMSGYGSTNIFGPYKNLTRAEAIQVIFNMAYGYNYSSGYNDSNLGYVDADGSYKTGFSDCDDSEWYARAIAWGVKAGIITGYGESGTFGPNDNITREQFATMIYRYASIKGDAKSMTAAEQTEALKSFPDTNSVSSWAKEAVAWAATYDPDGDGKNVIGNHGSIDPTSAIIRADAAAMTIYYQPEKDPTFTSRNY